MVQNQNISGQINGGYPHRFDVFVFYQAYRLVKAALYKQAVAAGATAQVCRGTDHP